MKEILVKKLKEVLKECIDYLDKENPSFENEKTHILGRLSIVMELLEEIR